MEGGQEEVQHVICGEQAGRQAGQSGKLNTEKGDGAAKDVVRRKVGGWFQLSRPTSWLNF